MAKRILYDWLREELHKEHWVTAANRYGDVLESTHIPAGVDLKRVLIEALARWSNDGWTVESFSSERSTFYCHKDGERLCIDIRPTDPSKPLMPSHFRP